MEENRKISPEPSVAQRVNEAIVNGKNDHTKPSNQDEANADQNILKIAAGVEEDTCQVVPVDDIKDDKETRIDDESASEVNNHISF